MTNIIFLYGTFAGLIVIGVMIAFIAAASGQPEMSDNSLITGYLTMIVALSMVFFGVKRYRDRDLGGVIKFVPAFLMGLAIAAVAGVIYVAGWEVYMAATDGAYMEAYMDHYIAGEKAKGLSGAALDKLVTEMNAMMTAYNTNMPYRMGITFMEIFPVGLIMALLSAVLLQYPKVLPARA
ncbi:MAG: DUF4199 domain-containing protein [Alphaproteobacteria bacterium]|nr:DUF4199 domain-containing protein [Alphaproteobacteria bacterium]